MDQTTLGLALAFGYLLGSIPFGLILTRMAGVGDIRKIGSGNIGATNVLRTGNKKLAGLTLVLDGLKGTVAVLLAGRYGLDYGIAAGIAAFVGHIFPVWLRFRGGKGVATYFGVVLGLNPLLWLITFIAWLAGAFLTRISAVGGLVAAITAPIAAWILNSSETQVIAMLAMSALIFLSHRQNIGRILKGTESRFGGGKRD